jgi:hypothetical protein
MDHRADCPPAYMIWDHDHALLEAAAAFYARIGEMAGATDWSDMQSFLAADSAPAGIDSTTWQAARAAHAGYQAGTEILLVLAFVAAGTDFHALKVNADLSIHIPDVLLDAAHQAEMAKVLVHRRHVRRDTRRERRHVLRTRVAGAML